MSTGRYAPGVPRLWNETIDAHRREVHGAILDATAALVAEHGLLGVTMSRIAEKAGIGRATLYKYFSDVKAILGAWHERQVAVHLRRLADARDGVRDADQRLEAVLAAFAGICHEARPHDDPELVSFMHQDDQVLRAQRHLHELVAELVAEGARAGRIRDDVSPDELADYCLHALTAASRLSSESAVRRLVAVTLAGLRPAS
ncbi:TetR family transcriptional regulator [Saccharothrix sp. NRRL B-16348]|nr:TetR family transcriptional regulator [Saccharothrix sp. NRRL B-16348]